MQFDPESLVSDKGTVSKPSLPTSFNVVIFVVQLHFQLFIHSPLSVLSLQQSRKDTEIDLYTNMSFKWDLITANSHIEIATVIICSMTNSFDLLSDLERRHWGPLFGF